MAPSILVIRLGAMGDIIHALPAVTSLRRSFPEHRLHWAIAPKWAALIEGNPSIDAIVPVNRRGLSNVKRSWRGLRVIRPDLAIDFQGLIQSAVVGRLSRPRLFYGFAKGAVRERPAALLYSRAISPKLTHVVDRNLELAQAAGADHLTGETWLPQGLKEGTLPADPFVLTNPFAGWMGKQWPLEKYEELGRVFRREGLVLVANVPPHRASELASFEHVRVHVSSLAGLIWASRQASAVVGLDSGPLHLAAALGKPGVALFGPTDPARNGPYGGTMEVLRAPDAATTYKRSEEVHPSMREISVQSVLEALVRSMARQPAPERRS